ncbi:MAG: hypothetical protein QG657_4543, partial [Acidobacteriota bacterium]|nr:hypothetical protein [Acidobacteriota bacterium]
FQWFIDEPSFPATHGLRASCNHSPWLSTHAALVSTAHEFHEFPRIIFVHRLHGFTLSTPTNIPFKINDTSDPGTYRQNDAHTACMFPRGFLIDYPRKQLNWIRHLKPYKQGPKSAQGMTHTLSLAPLGFSRLFLLPLHTKSFKENL